MARSKKKSGSSKKEFSSWVSTAPNKSKGGVGCQTCSHPGAETLRELLHAMIEHDAKHITRRQLYGKLKEEHDDFPVLFQAFRNHLYNHERELWEKAKGKRK